MELKLVRDVKGKSELYSFTGREKGKNLENVCLLLNGCRVLGTKGCRKSGILNVGIASVSIGRICLQESHTPEPRGSIWSSENFRQ